MSFELRVLNPAGVQVYAFRHSADYLTTALDRAAEEWPQGWKVQVVDVASGKPVRTVQCTFRSLSEHQP